MGRPRKTIAQKMADGDTRKVGALRHQESVESMLLRRRGRPELPAAFREIELARDASDEQIAFEVRKEQARIAWDEHCDALQLDGLLVLADAGMIEAMSMNRAMRLEAFMAGDGALMDKLEKTYLGYRSAMGMNETSAAKISRPKVERMSEEDLALAAGLPEDDMQPIQ